MTSPQTSNWHPFRPQMFVKIWISRFGSPKNSFSKGTHAPSPPDQHTTDKTEASEKIEVQAKSDILVFCFLSTQNIVSAFSYLILHRLQLGVHFATRITATCVGALYLEQNVESFAPFFE